MSDDVVSQSSGDKRSWWQRWVCLRSVGNDAPDLLEGVDEAFLKKRVHNAAIHGQDMARAATLLEDLAKSETHTSLSTTGGLGREQIIAEILRELKYGPVRRAFSESIWPYILIAYELATLAAWVYILAIRESSWLTMLSVHPTWNLGEIIGISAASGSVGAGSLTLYGIYTHVEYRSMDPGFTAWYIVRPILGGIMGAVSGLIGHFVFRGIDATGTGADIVIVAIAFLAGSNDRFMAQLIDRFTGQLMGLGSKSTKSHNSNIKPHAMRGRTEQEEP